MGNAAKKKININPLYLLFCILLLLVILIQPISILYNEKETFFSRSYFEQYESYQRAYYTSQYVQKKDPGIIPDQTLEAFAGGAFLRGINPILVIHDQPPLGRYLLSLSVLVFDNANTIMVLFFLFSGIGVFLVSKLVLQSTLFSFFPLAIFVNEPLFINKFYNSPLLEPIQLPFIIFALYFFIKGTISKKNYARWFISTTIMLGFVISIRFFMLGFFLVLAMSMYFLIRKKFDKRFVIFFLTLPISIVILIISYIRTIQLGSSILDIFSIQKYIYVYHKSQLTMPFSFWDLLFFNKWHTWWGERKIISDSQWVFYWPVTTVLAITFSFLGLLKKLMLSEAEKIIIIWVVMYSLFLSLGETSTRYFSPLLPFIYIISIDLLKRLFFQIRGIYKA